MRAGGVAALLCAVSAARVGHNSVFAQRGTHDTGKMAPVSELADVRMSEAVTLGPQDGRQERPDRALILVGGFGTRLRPLTLSVPKPLVPFGNKPMILHQIERLADAGVRHVVLAVSYRAEAMMAAMKEHGERLGIEIVFSLEAEPLGTAGPLALARAHLEASPGPFWVLNSDIICDFPFEEMAAFHAETRAEATILVTPVEDPSKYGVVVCAEGSSLVDRFVEKPQVHVGNRINAGVYLLEPSVLSRIRPRPTSIEKEVFPALASERVLHAFDLRGYWMDVGQPRDYLLGQGLYLDALARTSAHGAGRMPSVHREPRGTVLVHPSARIGAGVALGPNVVIGPGVVIEDGARILRSAIFEGAVVRAHAYVANSIVGWRSTVGPWARVEGLSVLGEDVSVAPEVHLNGAVVLPHKGITESQPTPRIIM